jgi:probable phosphoglycerate mutase
VPHFLYLVRHGEQQHAEHGVPDGPLSPRGKRQAMAIADRLGGVPFTAAWHAPTEGSQETAEVLQSRLPALEIKPSALLFDCIPSGPTPEMPRAFTPFFGGVTAAEIEAGQAQMADAVDVWLRPDGHAERHELLITHNSVIAWFVREVFQAPEWRWMGISQAHAGLTIIRVRSAKPPVLITHNDLGHLPVELRTGMPIEQPY